MIIEQKIEQDGGAGVRLVQREHATHPYGVILVILEGEELIPLPGMAMQFYKTVELARIQYNAMAAEIA